MNTWGLPDTDLYVISLASKEALDDVQLKLVVNQKDTHRYNRAYKMPISIKLPSTTSYFLLGDFAGCSYV